MLLRVRWACSRGLCVARCSGTARFLCPTMCLRSQCLTCVGKVGWLRKGSVRGLLPLGMVTTPRPQDTTRGTSPSMVAHQPQLPSILHYLLTQHIHLYTSMGSGTCTYSATQITPQFSIHPATFTPHCLCLPHQTQQTAFLTHSYSKTSMETSPTCHPITTSQPDTHRTQHSKLDHTLPPGILQSSKV